MFEVRIHGRGGQGALLTAELMAMAATMGGRFATVFPSFSVERAGAPAAAYCRLDGAPVRRRGPIYHPDCVILLDASLRHRAGAFAGLAPGGYALVSSLRDWWQLGLDRYATTLDRDRTVLLPATDLALAHTGQPLSCAVLLGGFAALTRQIGIEELALALQHRFPPQVANANVRAAKAAYGLVRPHLDGAASHGGEPRPAARLSAA